MAPALEQWASSTARAPAALLQHLLSSRRVGLGAPSALACRWCALERHRRAPRCGGAGGPIHSPAAVRRPLIQCALGPRHNLLYAMRGGRAEPLPAVLEAVAARQGGGADLRAHAAFRLEAGPPGSRRLGWRPSLYHAGMDPESDCWPGAFSAAPPARAWLATVAFGHGGRRSMGPWSCTLDLPASARLTCRSRPGGTRWAAGPVPGFAVRIRRSHQPGLGADAGLDAAAHRRTLQEQEADPALEAGPAAAPAHGGRWRKGQLREGQTLLLAVEWKLVAPLRVAVTTATPAPSPTIWSSRWPSCFWP